jgi:hypothetical protein
MPNYRSSEDRVDLDLFDFQVAFGVKTAIEGYPRHDPRYVEFAPILERRGKNETRSTYYPLAYHKCTPEEYKNFHTFNPA